MKKNTSKRKIHGILLLDKPLQISSNDALQRVKHLFYAMKAGHTGSLDPLASGMLPICFGEATKFSQFLLEADKRYFVVAKLGIKTTTGDAEGSIVEERPVQEISAEKLNAVLKQFNGAIQQIPSMYSAIKHQGKPLYQLARQGLTVERQARTVHIYELKLLAQTADTLTLEIACSKGTYIRTLVEDIGLALGCGAHVSALRRLTTANFAENEMVSLDALQKLAHDPMQMDQYLLPIDAAVRHIPLLTVSSAAAFYLERGQAIISPQAPKEGLVRIWVGTDRFLGIGEILSDGRVTPRKLVSLN